MAACRASSSTHSADSWPPRLAIHSSPSRFAARLRSSTMPHGQRRRTEPGLVVSRGDIFWIEADKTRGAVAGARIRTCSCERTSSTTPASARRRLRIELEPSQGLSARQCPPRAGTDGPSVVIVSQASCVYKARLGQYIGSLSRARVRWLPGYASYNKPFIAVAGVRGVRPGGSFGPVPVRVAQGRVG
jgi:mRNA interferase MazF